MSNLGNYDGWKLRTPEDELPPGGHDDDCACDECASTDEDPCSNCGGTGFSHHNCGEDCCSCADPEDNVPCDWCSP